MTKELQQNSTLYKELAYQQIKLTKQLPGQSWNYIDDTFDNYHDYECQELSKSNKLVVYSYEKYLEWVLKNTDQFYDIVILKASATVIRRLVFEDFKTNKEFYEDNVFKMVQGLQSNQLYDHWDPIIDVFITYNEYITYWEDDSIVNKSKTIYTYEKYCDYINTNGTYFDQAAIIVAANCLRTIIHVWDNMNGEWAYEGTGNRGVTSIYQPGINTPQDINSHVCIASLSNIHFIGSRIFNIEHYQLWQVLNSNYGVNQNTNVLGWVLSNA